MKKLTGFTLIEILIALMIFALLASITASSLYYSFNTQKRIKEQAQRLSALQLAVSILQKDGLQALARPIRTQNMQFIPAFVGRNNYFELTRDGNTNPHSLEKRSSLKRIALMCVNHTLVYRTWAALDAVNRNNYVEKRLLDKVSSCHFNYLNHNLQLLAEWREGALTQNQTKESLPIAIQVNLTLIGWGEANLLFMLPGGLYLA